MKTKKWIRTWIVIVIVVLPIVGGFNYVIDPYGENNYFNYPGINEIKQDERQLKFNYLYNNNNYESVILGNSKGTIIDPSVIKKFTGLETYNASFSAGTIDEFLEYTKWLINNRNIKQLFIVFEYYALTEYNSNGRMPPKLRPNTSFKSDYFSFSKFKSSIKVILNNITFIEDLRNERKVYLDKGMRYYTKYFERQNSIEKQLEHIEFLKSAKITWLGKNISEERINNLKEIVTLCKENNIELFLLQTPSSYRILNINDRKNYRKLLSLIKTIALEIHPVYFFNDFNYINNNLKYFLDNNHFNYDVNELIFERVFLDKGIGLKITPNNAYKIDTLLELERDNKLKEK